jgi:hypothetical protein
MLRTTTTAGLFISVALLTFLARGGDRTLAQCSDPPGAGGSPPTFGMLRWDLRGGEPDAAGGNGGPGGRIEIVASDSIVHDDSRSRPGSAIGANILAGVLADNVVTYAELTTLTGFSGAGTTNPQLSVPSGSGFALPSTATLDLSDTPGNVSNLSITTSNDVIVLDGNIEAVRTSGQPVSLFMRATVSPAASPVAFVFSSVADFGASQGFDGPQVTFESSNDAVFTGQILGRGGAGIAAVNSGAGGRGGEFILIATGGDVLLGSGFADASGADAAVSGFGGLGGSVELQAEGNDQTDFDWGARVNGGAGAGSSSSGGAGGEYSAIVGSVSALSIRAEANGGSGATDGGDGGTIGVGGSGSYSGHLLGLANGGDGGADGGSGGAVGLFGDSLESVTLGGTANGGLGGLDEDENGGRGGRLDLLAGEFDDVLATFAADGGRGWESGRGGDGNVQVFNSATSHLNDSRIEFSGKSGTSPAHAAPGGEFALRGQFDASCFELVVDVSSGIADTGLDNTGGTVDIELSGNRTLEADMDIRADGPEGRLTIANVSGGTDFSGSLKFSAQGRTNSLAEGGSRAGRFFFRPASSTSTPGSVDMTWEILLHGGDSFGPPEGPAAATGGMGGFVEVDVFDGTTFHLSSLKIDVRGGNGDISRGGDAGAVTMNLDGDVQVDSGSIRFGGGNGSPTASGGFAAAGTAGAVLITTNEGSLNWAADIIGNGWTDNDGVGSGTESAPAGSVTFNLNRDGDSAGGGLELGGTCFARGGTLRAFTGSLGGNFTVTDGNATTGGAVSFTGLVDVGGGVIEHPNSPGWNQTTGGVAGRINVSVAGAITVSGTLKSNGGSAHFGGQSFFPLLLGSNRAATLTLTSSAIVEAEGGDGDGVSHAGEGGTIELDPTGAGPSNPNLVEQSGSVVSVAGSPAGTIVRD